MIKADDERITECHGISPNRNLSAIMEECDDSLEMKLKMYSTHYFPYCHGYEIVPSHLRLSLLSSPDETLITTKIL